MAEALGDVFNVKVSTDFIEKNMNDIKKAVNGDIDAFERLQIAAAQDYVANLDINADTSRIEEVKTELNNFIDEYNGKNIGFTATMDNSQFVRSLNDMMKNGELTEQQVNEYLAGIGYEGEVGYTEGPETKSTSTVKGSILGKEFTIGKIETATTSQVPYLKSVTKTSNAKSRAKTFKSGTTGSNKVGGGSGKSGGGSKKEKNQSDETADRYQEVNKKLETTSTLLSRLQDQEDKLLGKNLINNLNQQLDKLNTQIDLTKQKLTIAQAEQNEYATKLNNYGVKFNADGSINQQSYVNTFNTEQNRYNNAYTDDEAAKKR